MIDGLIPCLNTEFFRLLILLCLQGGSVILLNSDIVEILQKTLSEQYIDSENHLLLETN